MPKPNSTILGPEKHCWGIIGPNGSGKSTLAADLAHEHPRSSLVSFEVEDTLLERMIREDDSEFLDKIDPGKTVRELIEESRIQPSESIDTLISKLGLTDLSDRGFRLLSTGERRRLMLARALIQAPELLILDEPFDGLDREFRNYLSKWLRELSHDIQLIVVVNRLSDLDDWITHLAVVDNGTFILSGKRDLIENNEVFAQFMELGDDAIHLPAKPSSSIVTPPEGPLVVMKQVSVIHDNRHIIDSFDWLVEHGQNWKISGPNGCGKSTLVNLITGDHPQCYSNDVTVMGMRRGTGETIWDVKNLIGIVSPTLHQQYRVGINALSVITSGFFDSVGLYQEVDPALLKIASDWLELIKMSELKDRQFRSLSYGHQRLLLIARALVKQPPLLILDEPCQGLDAMNRALVLRTIDHIVGTGVTQLLYITHEPEDALKCITNELIHDGSGWKKLPA